MGASNTKIKVMLVSTLFLVFLFYTPSTAPLSFKAYGLPDAPLLVNVTEYLNATIETDGVNTHCRAWNVSGNITIWNSNTGETVSDIWIPINENSTYTYTWTIPYEKPTYADVSEIPAGNVPSEIKSKFPNNQADKWVHVTELRSGDRVVLWYTVTWTGGNQPQCPPITVSEKVSPNKIVDGQSQTLTINLTITNNLWYTVNFRVRKILPADGTSNDGWSNAVANNPQFTSAGTATVGNTGLTSDSKRLNWTSNGDWPDNWFTLNSGASGTIRNFQVQGTPDLREVGGQTTKIEIGRVYVYFTAQKTFTNTTLGYIFSIGQADIEARKEQGTYATNTWNETNIFYSTSATFKYELYNMTTWATQGDTPDSTLVSGSSHSVTGDPIATVEPLGNYSDGGLNFTYNGVPKIWVIDKFRIAKDQQKGWWVYNYTRTSEKPDGNSTYLVIEKVWVVKGYLIKAVKEVRSDPSTPNKYNILIEVHNLGQWTSPYVSVYDLVPTNFNPDPPATEGGMIFKPLSMLANDADANSPPDYSRKTTPTGYSGGYVWDIYPMPAPQHGFAEWFNGTGSSNQENVNVTLTDGTQRTWTVYPVSNSAVNINGTNYNEGANFTVNSGLSSETNFTVTFIQDSLNSTEGGKVVVSAKGFYTNLGINVTNPVIIYYNVSGTGVYKALDLFIVGVDPRHTLNALAIFQPETTLSSGTVTFEYLLATLGAAVFVSALFPLKLKNKKGGKESLTE